MRIAQPCACTCRLAERLCPVTSAGSLAIGRVTLQPHPSLFCCRSQSLSAAGACSRMRGSGSYTAALMIRLAIGSLSSGRLHNMLLCLQLLPEKSLGCHISHSPATAMLARSAPSVCPMLPDLILPPFQLPCWQYGCILCLSWVPCWGISINRVACFLASSKQEKAASSRVQSIAVSQFRRGEVLLPGRSPSLV